MAREHPEKCQRSISGKSHRCTLLLPSGSCTDVHLRPRGFQSGQHFMKVCYPHRGRGESHWRLQPCWATMLAKQRPVFFFFTYIVYLYRCKVKTQRKVCGFDQNDMREVSFFTEREGGSQILGDQIPVLRSKGGSLIFLKETKYFVKHFRFQRKRLSDATQGRKLQ